LARPGKHLASRGRPEGFLPLRLWLGRLPADEAGWRAAGFLYGSVERVVKDLRRWEELGIARLMLQLLDQEDLDMIELIARHVLPEFRR